MQILEVLIEYGLSSLDRTFSYFYNGEKTLSSGIRVLVNFNNKDIIGYVLSVKEYQGTVEEYQKESIYVVKEVKEIIDETPLLNSELQNLAKDIADYYFSPLISVYQAMLPPSLKPKKSALTKPKISYDTYVHLVDKDEFGLTTKQVELVRFLKQNGEILKKELKPNLVKALYEKKKIEFVLKEKIRLVQEEVIKREDNSLNDEQRKALDSICDEDYSTYLLEGVTGSGKTEVYLQASRRFIENGKTVLMLVPEISLTTSMLRRFKERFDHIAILHSGLSASEKYDEYRLIEQNKVNIVVGARSAIFAPLKNIGLIIIDEEHVETYKQDVSPFYHAIKVAFMRQKYHGCKIVLGSATPSLETKARALKGVYHQLYLTKRFNSSPLPLTQIVNMSSYQNIDNDSFIFSKKLKEKINDRLNKKEQVILLINKRGYAPYIQCSKCNKVISCPNCGVVLTYHKTDDMLKCHHCGFVDFAPKKCDKCGNNKFYKIGFGTEKVYEEASRLFKGARIGRIDSDVASIKHKLDEVLDKFENSEIDILIGTQMIAKGHDFSNVTLVGIVLADLGLNIPSFKSSERTFNLITQAIGRGGRKNKEGEAIIQTYNPNNYVIYDSSIQDYSRFFNEEMKVRKINHNPPYYYLVLITLSSKNKDYLISSCAEIKSILEAKFFNKVVEVIGPSEPYISKMNGKFQRKFLVKYKNIDDVKEPLRELLNVVNKRSNLSIKLNVDPDNDY